MSVNVRDVLTQVELNYIGGEKTNNIENKHCEIKYQSAQFRH